MINCVIIDSNYENIKRLSNRILVKIADTRIIGIATNINELYKVFNYQKATLVFTSKEFYKDVSELYMNKKALIICTQNKTNLVESKKTSINFASKDSEIVTSIIQFISINNISCIQDNVTSVLKRLNFNFSLIGTKYLISTILLTTFQTSDHLNLEKDIYPTVAFKYHTTSMNVKQAIVRSINSITIAPSYTAALKYLNILPPDKPTAKNLINAIAEKLR